MSKICKKPCIIVDCDGVLIDPVRGFVRWFFATMPYMDFSIILKNGQLLNGLFTTYLYSDDFSQIPPIFGAKDAILSLSNSFNIDIITSCGNNSLIRHARLKNLEKIFGLESFRNIYTLPYLASKKKIYSQYDKGTIVIDDDLFNIVEANSCGHDVYWMKYHKKFSKILYPNISKISLEDKKIYKTTNWDKIIKSISSISCSK